MYNFYLHFPSSFSPIFLPISSGLYWVISGNIFFIYLALSTFVFGELFNRFLKNILSQIFQNETWALRPNPNSPCNNFMQPMPNNTFGFPSGHSQNVGVFCSLLICYLLNCCDNSIEKSICLLIFSIYVGWSRMELGCHNLVQVSTGIIIGYYLGINLWKIYTLLNNLICKKNL